ncbi:MAG: ABC transporter substrate-binding protein [Deltaproteobacteria bacterium]|nr:ABC transporter substrate-binding protein [Deltaproteobacteria bacterium]
MRKRQFKLLALLTTFVVATVIGISLPAPVLAKGEPIIIGVPVSMGVFYGPDVRDGLALGIKEINAAGGVNVGGDKRPFKMIIADTRAMEPGVPITESLLAIERLIAQQKADFLVGGPVRSEAAFAARPLITQYKKVSMITTGCYSPRYGDAKKYPYCFRIIGDVVFEIPNVHIRLLKDLKEAYGYKKMYIIVQDVKHARAAGGFVEKLAKKEGFEILGKDIYPTGSTDFSMSLLAAKKKGAQILFLWIDMPELTILAKQYYDFKIPALPLGYLGPAEHLEWWRTTEGKGEYFIVDLLRAGLAPSEATPWTMKFVNAFKKEYGQEPDALGHSESYMGAYLLKDAIERAGTLNSDAVADALRATDMMGVYGRMRFNENNEIIFDPDFDPAKGAVGTVIQWQKDKRITVFPTTIAVGKIQLPPWMK